MSESAKRHAPATGRNREAISQVLAAELPATGLVLEVASGSGEHAVHFARLFPQLRWQPSDANPDALASTEAWGQEAGLPNLHAPLEVDASAPTWPMTSADAVLCINMPHISPMSATEGLFAGAALLLALNAPLVLYGPFLEAGLVTAPSNLAFDRDLKARDSAWGLRAVEWLDEVALRTGFLRTRRVAMPANNLTLVYRRA